MRGATTGPAADSCFADPLHAPGKPHGEDAPAATNRGRPWKHPRHTSHRHPEGTCHESPAPHPAQGARRDGTPQKRQGRRSVWQPVEIHHRAGWRQRQLSRNLRILCQRRGLSRLMSVSDDAVFEDELSVYTNMFEKFFTVDCLQGMHIHWKGHRQFPEFIEQGAKLKICLAPIDCKINVGCRTRRPEGTRTQNRCTLYCRFSGKYALRHANDCRRKSSRRKC